MVVKLGQWCDFDFLSQGNLGDLVSFQKILLLRTKNQVQVGKPFLNKSQIPGKLIQHVQGKKIVVLKTKPKKRYTRTRGHRQTYTRFFFDNFE